MRTRHFAAIAVVLLLIVFFFTGKETEIVSTEAPLPPVERLPPPKLGLSIEKISIQEIGTEALPEYEVLWIFDGLADEESKRFMSQTSLYLSDNGYIYSYQDAPGSFTARIRPTWSKPEFRDSEVYPNMLALAKREFPFAMTRASEFSPHLREEIHEPFVCDVKFDGIDLEPDDTGLHLLNALHDRSLGVLDGGLKHEQSIVAAGIGGATISVDIVRDTDTI